MRRRRLPAIVAWLWFVSGVLLIVADLIDANPSGLGLLGIVYLILWLWLIGAFRADFWIADTTENHPETLSRLDRLDGVGNRKEPAA